MTIQGRKEAIEHLNFLATSVIEVKGNSYAINEDALKNFKQCGEDFGLTKYQVWGIFFDKHVCSIKKAIRTDPVTPRDESEGLKERIIDARNYLDLLYCLLVDDEVYSVKLGID